MKNKNLFILFLFLQIFFIIYNAYSQQNKDFVSKEKIIEIIKLSSQKFRKGYNTIQIENNHIKFYVNNDLVIYYNTFYKKFEKNGIFLTQEQLSKIHNFIGYINENASEYKKMKFDLIDVYENLKYMNPANIDFVKLEELLKIIKLSGKRKQGGYKKNLIDRYKILFYINYDVLVDFKNIESLFKKNNINLTQEQVSKIHNFIGYIAENAREYKKLKFNLIDVYKNLQYMK